MRREKSEPVWEDRGAPPWKKLRTLLGLDAFDESFARLMWRLAGDAPPPPPPLSLV